MSEIETAPAPLQSPSMNGNASEPTVADEAIAAAERIAFLAMASELARGRKVLVVDDGASALTGVAERLDSASIADLDTHANGTFDLVVADLLAAGNEEAFGIEQLARVVDAAGGAALVRLPNRPEFAPLQATLEGTFAKTLVMRQHNWVASALFDDAMFANEDPSRAVAASVRKLQAAQPGDELYTVVLAAQGEFPDFRPQLAVTRSALLRDLMTELHATRELAAQQLEEREARLQAQAEKIAELEDELTWYDEHELALRSEIESRPWAMNLLDLWGRLLRLSRRARNALNR